MNYLLVKNFNGMSIYNFVWKNKPCWIAIDVTKVIGYVEGSNIITACINRERFKEGREYELLRGNNLKKFKELVGDKMSKSLKFAPKLIIFYEEGLYGFLQYTEKSIGVTFRTWIRLEVMPELSKNGVYVMDDRYHKKEKDKYEDYYDKTYNSDIEFNCENEYDSKVNSKVKENIIKEGKLSVVEGKYIEVDKLNNSLDKNDFDIDKFQRLRMATESARLLKDLLDDVDTDSICKLAVVKSLFSEAGIELPIYFNKSN